MHSASIADRVTAFIQPVVEDELGFELVDVEYVKEGADWYLRIYIDHPEGIDLNACERVSRRIDPLLDEYDRDNALFPGSYILEVSSPGLTRPLKKERDFIKYQGRLVTVKTYAPIGGQKEFNGILRDYRPAEIEIEVNGERMVIPKDRISLVHLAVEF
ncbi:MAG TPA: ribosome maturation factor RimP [Clostridia bacterium]|nr:ribosome maturation factor RimP [Clostridia bacterium]